MLTKTQTTKDNKLFIFIDVSYVLKKNICKCMLIIHKIQYNKH